MLAMVASTAIAFQASAVDIQEAREKFEQLAGRPADDAWHFVGVSALRLNPPAPAGGAAADSDAEEAEAAARAAVGLDDAPAAFETFLKLAPDAPERGRVESVLRTLRGRG